MFRRSVHALIGLALCSTAAFADMQGFSFDYQMIGERTITPYQVFDDGVSMYLQFRDPGKVPSIFVREGDGASRPVTPEVQGQYLRIPGVASRLELVSSDRKTASILSTRKVVATAPKAPLVYEAPRAQAMMPAAPAPALASPARPAAAPPLYARRAADARTVPVATSAPAYEPPSETAQLRQEIEQLRRVLDAMASRIGQGGSSAPQNLSPALYEPGPRVLNVRADTAPVQVASPGHGPGNGSGGNGHGYSGAAGVASMAVPVAYAAAPQRAYSFKVDAGQRLSEAVRQFVGAQGLELDWDTGGADYEIKFAFAVTGGSVDEALYGVLSQFKLNAVTKRGNNVVAVTRAS